MEVSQCIGHGALACTAKIRVGNGALHVKRTCGSVTVCWPWCTGLHRQESCWQWSLHVKRTCGSVTVCWPWCTGLHRQDSCLQQSSSREENVWKCHSVLAMVHWLAPPRFVFALACSQDSSREEQCVGYGVLGDSCLQHSEVWKSPWWLWCTGLHRQDSCLQQSSSREENVWKCHSVLAMVHWLAPPRFVLAMELFT